MTNPDSSNQDPNNPPPWYYTSTNWKTKIKINPERWQETRHKTEFEIGW